MTNEKQSSEEIKDVFGDIYRKNKHAELDGEISKLAENLIYKKLKMNYEITWGTFEKPISDYENKVRLSATPNEPRVSRETYLENLCVKINQLEENLKNSRRGQFNDSDPHKVYWYMGNCGLGCSTYASSGEQMRRTEEEFTKKNAEFYERQLKEITERKSAILEENKKIEPPERKKNIFKERIARILLNVANYISTPIFIEEDESEAYTNWLQMKGGPE